MEYQERSFLQDDILNRFKIVKEIEDYISILEKMNPCSSVSIALNAKWGSGKTFFVSMWRNHLESNNIKTVYYNAWENDDCDSAILPILYRIVLLKKDESDEAFLGYAKKFLKTLAVETTKFGVEKFFGNTSGIGEILKKGIDGLTSYEASSIFEEYDQYYGNRRLLEENLKELVPNNGKLWIFIDDLDRCNPEFAIATLECIKHFFNIKNIIYILSIDLEQLRLITTKVYGSDIDANSYLKRFFDIVYQMPDADFITYIKTKVQDMNVRQEIKKYIQYQELEKLFRHFKCSLRDINLSLAHLEIFLLRNSDKIDKCKTPKNTLNIYYYFMVIKDKYNITYLDIIHGNFSLEDGKSHRKKIDYMYIYNEQIKKLLSKISDDRAMMHTKDIIKQLGLIDDDNIKTFKQHMEIYLS